MENPTACVPPSQGTTPCTTSPPPLPGTLPPWCLLDWSLPRSLSPLHSKISLLSHTTLSLSLLIFHLDQLDWMELLWAPWLPFGGPAVFAGLQHRLRGSCGQSLPPHLQLQLFQEDPVSSARTWLADVAALPTSQWCQNASWPWEPAASWAGGWLRLRVCSLDSDTLTVLQCRWAATLFQVVMPQLEVVQPNVTELAWRQDETLEVRFWCNHPGLHRVDVLLDSVLPPYHQVAVLLEYPVACQPGQPTILLLPPSSDAVADPTRGQYRVLVQASSTTSMSEVLRGVSTPLVVLPPAAAGGGGGPGGAFP